MTFNITFHEHLTSFITASFVGACSWHFPIAWHTLFYCSIIVSCTLIFFCHIVLIGSDIIINFLLRSTQFSLNISFLNRVSQTSCMQHYHSIHNHSHVLQFNGKLFLSVRHVIIEFHLVHDH